MRIDLAQAGLTFPTRDQKMWNFKIGRVVGKKQFISFVCYRSSYLKKKADRLSIIIVNK